MVLFKLFLSFCAFTGLMVFVNAEDIIPESPITQATCDGIKSIEADTVGSQTVSCMVQEGCGTVMCSSPLMPLASNDITFQPCTEVPSIYVEFFNASESADEPVLNQTITQTTTISLTELGLTFIFTITQQANANAILFKVNVVFGGIPVPYITERTISMDPSLCPGRDSAGNTQVVTSSVLVFLVFACSVLLMMLY